MLTVGLVLPRALAKRDQRPGTCVVCPRRRWWNGERVFYLHCRLRHSAYPRGASVDAGNSGRCDDDLAGEGLWLEISVILDIGGDLICGLRDGLLERGGVGKVDDGLNAVGRGRVRELDHLPVLEAVRAPVLADERHVLLEVVLKVELGRWVILIDDIEDVCHFCDFKGCETRSWVCLCLNDEDVFGFGGKTWV